MKTVTDLVTAVRDLYGSDRKAAPQFGVTQSTFSDWRNGDASPTDDNALKVAELLALDPAYVLAIVRHDRSESDRAKKVWRRVAEQFAVIALVSIGAGILPAPSGAPAQSAGQPCVLCKMRRCPIHRLGRPLRSSLTAQAAP